jgi:uncharacterized protein (TIGR02145 family)
VGYDLSANNATGFSAYPAGYYNSGYSTNGAGAYFWTATNYGSSSSYYVSISNSSYYPVYQYGNPSYYAHSVRCLRDVVSVSEMNNQLEQQQQQLEQQQQQLDSLQNALDSLQDILPNFYYVPTSGTKTITLGSDITNLMVYDYSGPGGNYGNNWDGKLVLVTNRPNSIFRITGNCQTEGLSWDYVELYNGSGTTESNRIIRVGGTGTIGSGSNYIYTSGNTVTIHFRTDGSNVGEGFALNIAVVTNSACPSKAVDVEGNFYTTVKIGNQCWMKQNLRVTKYANLEGITLKSDATISDTSIVTAYRYNPANDANNVATYGYLYNWAAVMHGASGSNTNPSGVQGICPSGWHVPAYAEWGQLQNYLSSNDNYVCTNSANNTTFIAKSLASTSNWNTSTTTCAVGNGLSSNNASGFSALPAGQYYTSNFYSIGLYAWFWSSLGYTVGLSNYAHAVGISYSSPLVGSGQYLKSYGEAVRCVRNQ